MRARDLELAPGAGAEHGIRHGVVGIGPGRGDKAGRVLHRFATVPDGVFVWTRDCDGDYHLGRISGPMNENRSRAARAVGIVYVRPTHWLQRVFAESEVPRGVAANFARGGRNFQRIHDEESERLTAELWAADVQERPRLGIGLGSSGVGKGAGTEQRSRARRAAGAWLRFPFWRGRT